MPTATKFLLIWGLFILASSVGCQEKSISIQGYMEGQFRYIASNRAGQLKYLWVQRGDHIKAHQPLFRLDDQPELALWQQAAALVTSAQAQIKQQNSVVEIHKLQETRTQVLAKRAFSSQQDKENAEQTLWQAQASLQAATANLRNAEAYMNAAFWRYQQKFLRAPIDALVFDTYFLPGEQIPAGTPVVCLLAACDIKAIFFVSEKLLATLKLGQIVTLTADSMEKSSPAKIIYIGATAEYTPPVIYSNETREKLVYRIEALPIGCEQHMLFHPGQPVTVTLSAAHAS